MKNSNANPEEKKEVYILKIYRREKKPAKSLVGTIEEIHGERKGVFNSEKDLLDWLAEPKAKE